MIPRFAAGPPRRSTSSTGWATGSKGRKGTYRPNAKEFGRFAEAAGRQFPQVDIWSIWNEPNLYSWLSPPRRKGVPVPPSISRSLSRAGPRGGGRSANHHPILRGGLMPGGGPEEPKLPPLQF